MCANDWSNQNSKLVSRLGHSWQRPSLLLEALTHSTWTHEQAGESQNYERLEFLGDAVLQVMVSEHLFELFASASEGELSRRRAQAVGQPTLVRCARELDLVEWIRLGHGQRHSGVPDSVLADVVEALVGALYIDGGLAASRGMYRRWLAPFVQKTHARADAKTRLQELCHKRSWTPPRYELEEVSGLSHQRRYTMVVHLGHGIEERATASSKKTAEQTCAQQALDALGIND